MCSDDFWQLDLPDGGFLGSILLQFIQNMKQYEASLTIAHGQALLFIVVRPGVFFCFVHSLCFFLWMALCLTGFLCLLDLCNLIRSSPLAYICFSSGVSDNRLCLGVRKHWPTDFVKWGSSQSVAQFLCKGFLFWRDHQISVLGDIMVDRLSWQAQASLAVVCLLEPSRLDGSLSHGARLLI